MFQIRYNYFESVFFNFDEITILLELAKIILNLNSLSKVELRKLSIIKQECQIVLVQKNISYLFISNIYLIRLLTDSNFW
jgi:hypothetical protein